MCRSTTEGGQHFNLFAASSLQSFKGSQGGNAIPDVEIPRYISLIELKKMNLNGLITHEFTLMKSMKLWMFSGVVWLGEL